MRCAFLLCLPLYRILSVLGDAVVGCSAAEKILTEPFNPVTPPAELNTVLIEIFSSSSSLGVA